MASAKGPKTLRCVFCPQRLKPLLPHALSARLKRLLKKSPGGHSEGAIKRSFLLATEESAFVFNTANQQQILRRAQDDRAFSFFSNGLFNRL
jgi:hypothetical protein